VINVLARIDHLASGGGTVWHRAAALTKLLLAAAIVTLAVATPSLAVLAALYGVAGALVLASRVPPRIAAVAALYPVVFVAMFVIASWDGSWRDAARMALRPLTSALAALWLVATTPYPDLFAPISRVLPRSVGDGLFLTYRALFELIARLERLWRAWRVRGGPGGMRRLEAVGEGLGTAVLYGFERSQRQYATMLLRGHSGRICGCRHWAEVGRADLAVAAAALVVAAIAAFGWRLP
jgi:cobalt/nickel transport system permease protein